MESEVLKLGGKIILSANISSISYNSQIDKINISYFDSALNKEKINLETEFIFSTIPITRLVELIIPKAKSDISNAMKNLKYRSMVLLYFIIDAEKFSDYDAHYFPEIDLIFSRISESKNYSGTKFPLNKTGICVEIPCQEGDTIWNYSDDQLSNIVIEQLDKIGLSIKSPISSIFTKHIKFVYPLYDLHFEKNFKLIDDYIKNVPKLISLGRQGLFAHDNTHHTIEMAYRASNCLDSQLEWNSNLWAEHINDFDKNVVED